MLSILTVQQYSQSHMSRNEIHQDQEYTILRMDRDCHHTVTVVKTAPLLTPQSHLTNHRVSYNTSTTSISYKNSLHTQHKSHQFQRKFKMKCHAFNLSKKEAFITMLTFLQIKLSIHRQSIMHGEKAVKCTYYMKQNYCYHLNNYKPECHECANI